jgi:tellurite resistance protein TerC
MHVSTWAYVALGVALVGALAVDLVLLRRPGAGSMRSAAIATGAWTAIGLLATLPVILFDGSGAGAHYVTIYLLERALSLDNVAVFAIVLAALRVPPARRESLVVIGVGIALVLRIALIGGGLALVDALHATLYIFGALLLLTGLNTIRSGLPADTGEHEEGGRLLRLAARIGGRSAMFGPILALAVADVVFAVDSIPAAFGITRDVFPIVAANGFSVLGLHAAYVLLQGGMARFRYLDTGLGVVLVLIGIELVTEDLVHLPSWLTLVVVVVVLVGAIVLSVRADQSSPRPKPAGEG